MNAAEIGPMETAKASGRKTICYVGGFELPDRNAAALRVLSNAHILRALGYRVVLIGISRDVLPTAPIQREHHEGLPFECWARPYPASTGQWLSHVVDVRALTDTIAREAGEDLAAVICYDFPAIAQERLRRFVKARGAIAIAEATEWYSASRINGLAAVVKNIDRPLRMRVVNRRMDGVICASDYLRDFYRQAGLPAVSLPTLMPDAAAALMPATPDGAPKRLFFAGHGFDPSVIRELKSGAKDRLDMVIAALHRARQLGAEFELDVFGTDKQSYLAVMPGHVPAIEELGGRVRFHGRQPRSIVRDVLARADFSIFLRANTIVTLAGFPTKFAESIHFGTPVITNPIGSLTAYHQEGRTGYYIDYDDPALAGRQLAAILATSSAAVSAMKEFCHASRMFHYSAHIEALDKFLHDAGVRKCCTN